MRALAIAALTLAACASSNGQQQAPPSGETTPPQVTAPAAPERQAHGFPLHESLTLVCSQTVTAPPPGGEIHWSLYASPRPPEEVAAWYGTRLPAANLEQSADGWTWRLPAASSPRNVMSLYAATRGGMPTCGTTPPADARALVNVSEMPAR